MEKANEMMNDNAHCWYALHTAPKLEYKLMRQLHAAGYATYCPMQTVIVNWRGEKKEVVTPLFSGCLFVEGDAVALTSFMASCKAGFLLNNDGKSLSIVADKASLSSKFTQLFK